MIDFWVNNKSFIMPLLFGLILTIAGFYRNYKIETIRKDGIKTTAEIVDYKSKMSYTTDPITQYYYSVFRFTDNNGKERQIVDYSVGSSIKSKKKLPFKLEIYYKQNDGEFEIITGSKSNDIIAMGILIIGLTLVIVTLFLFFNK